MTAASDQVPNRTQRRALERRAKRQPATSPPMTAEQAQAHVQGFIYQRAKETLEVVTTLLELVDDDGVEAELIEAETILRRTVVAAGMALLRPAVEAIATAQEQALAATSEAALKVQAPATDTQDSGTITSDATDPA